MYVECATTAFAVRSSAAHMQPFSSELHLCGVWPIFLSLPCVEEKKK